MKITKSRLKEIIKEEIDVVLAENETPNLEDAQRAVQQAASFGYEVALYKYLKDNGHDVQRVFDKLKKAPRGYGKRIKIAQRLGINLEDGVQIRSYDTLRPQPAPIRPSVSGQSLSTVIANASEKKLLSPEEMEQLDMQITKAYEDFEKAFDAQKKKRPHDPQAALRYGSTGKLGS